jgi:hypothetical protein
MLAIFGHARAIICRVRVGIIGLAIASLFYELER